MPNIQTRRLNMWYERYPATTDIVQDAPIILHAGLSMQAIFWPDTLIETLNAEGFDVVIFDNRDIGMTEHMTGTRAPSPFAIIPERLARRTPKVPYRIPDMADDTAALMDALEIQEAHIAGMSMGGMIVQSVAIRHPERVRSLCCWSTSTGLITDQLISARMIPLILKRPSADPKQRLEDGVEMFERIGTRRYPSDTEELHAVIGLAAQRSTDDLQGVPRQLAAILASPSRRRALKSLRVPTLVIHGTRDPLQPLRCGKALARLIPEADLHLVPGYGHNLPKVLMADFGHRIARNARRKIV